MDRCVTRLANKKTEREKTQTITSIPYIKMEKEKGGKELVLYANKCCELNCPPEEMYLGFRGGGSGKEPAG